MEVGNPYVLTMYLKIYMYVFMEVHNPVYLLCTMPVAKPFPHLI